MEQGKRVPAEESCRRALALVHEALRLLDEAQFNSPGVAHLDLAACSLDAELAAKFGATSSKHPFAN